MKVYVTVEGEIGAKRLYEHWIPQVNESLSSVSYPHLAACNNFYVAAGGGYPAYFSVIESAVEDVTRYRYDRLVVAVDSENNTYEEKRNEILQLPSLQSLPTQLNVIVQHFCFETWALGNERLGPRRPRTDRLRAYKEFYDVLALDPEGLPENAALKLNRAQFAFSYLVAMLNDKHRNLSYSKNNPTALLHNSYFREVNNRFVRRGHISSFDDFLVAFS